MTDGGDARRSRRCRRPGRAWCSRRTAVEPPALGVLDVADQGEGGRGNHGDLLRVGREYQKEIAVLFLMCQPTSCPGPDGVRMDALVAAARELVARGADADRRGGGRAGGRVAHDGVPLLRQPDRSPGRRAPRGAATSFLDETAPEDPVARVEQVLDRYLDGADATSEAQQRTMLRLSLDPDLDDERRAALPLRQGRVIGWLGEALEPLADRWSDAGATPSRLRDPRRRRYRVAGVARGRRRLLPRRGQGADAVVRDGSARGGTPVGPADSLA